MRRREFLALGCGAAAACRRRGISERPLRVAATPHFTMSGLHMAAEMGAFQKAGLAVEITQMGSSTQIAPLLAGGELEVAFVGLNTPFLNAVERGAQMRIVAGRAYASPTCGAIGTMYSTRRLFPDGPSDIRRLRGRQVGGVQQANISEFVFDLLLASAGMSGNDVKTIQLEDSDAIAALLAGRVDAVVISNLDKDPASLDPAIVRVTGLAQVAPNYQYGFIYYGRTLLEADREIGEKFLAAYLTGIRAFVGGRTPRFLEELARLTRMDPGLVRAACRDQFVVDGAIDEASVQRFLNWAAGKKYCPRLLQAGQLIDGGYLEGARRRLEGNT
jgi:ABC-type nitrate/sulfonate/bicarbonate transport system substrate-binding protein